MGMSSERIFFGTSALLFLGFTAVQLNDPDGMLWAALYGFCALLSGLAFFRKGRPDWSTYGFLFYGILAVALALIAENFRISNEEARESLGMLLCALWFLAYRKSSFGSGDPA